MYQSNTNMRIIHGYHILLFLLYVDILYCTVKKIQWLISIGQLATALVLLCYIFPWPLYLILKSTPLYEKSRRWANLIEEIQTFQLVIASVTFFDLNQFAFSNIISNKTRTIVALVLLFVVLFYGNHYRRKCLVQGDSHW